MTEQREQGPSWGGPDEPTQALPSTAGVGDDLDGPTAPLEAGQRAGGGATVLPGSAGPRAVPPRTRATDRVPRSGAGGVQGGPKQRRARLRLRHVDPWSVLLLALLVSLFLAVALVVAVVAVYAVLDAAGVPDSVNALVGEITRAPGDVGPPPPLLTAGRALTAAGIVAVSNVVLLTGLATLAAVLYNLCASFTGGVEVTLAEDDR